MKILGYDVAAVTRTALDTSSRFGRGVFNGFTLGFGDDIRAGVDTAFNGKSFHENQRAEYAATRRGGDACQTGQIIGTMADLAAGAVLVPGIAATYPGLVAGMGIAVAPVGAYAYHQHVEHGQPNPLPTPHPHAPLVAQTLKPMVR